MAAILLDGAALAAEIRASLTERVAALTAAGVQPGLGTILVGDNPSSATYVRLKHSDCAEIGVASFGEELPASASQDALFAAIRRFNQDDAVDAFLVQMPLPGGLDEEAALLAVDPDKDVDGLHPVHHGVPVEGRHVVIVGRGLTIGRPLALLLTLKRPNGNAAVTVVHTGVKDLGAYTRQGDIVVAAAGSPGLVTAGMVRPGAAVVGGGVTMDGKRILSDVDEGVAEVAGWVTPRVGGVGPMTRAMLLRNAVAAAERRAERLGLAV